MTAVSVIETATVVVSAAIEEVLNGEDSITSSVGTIEEMTEGEVGTTSTDTTVAIDSMAAKAGTTYRATEEVVAVSANVLRCIVASILWCVRLSVDPFQSFLPRLIDVSSNLFSCRFGDPACIHRCLKFAL